jgi:hypothetical protein
MLVVQEQGLLEGGVGSRGLGAMVVRGQGSGTVLAEALTEVPDGAW